MPTLFLSPSLQEWNYYNGGGNEEYYMNLIADEMIPYLTASGVTVVRNDISRDLRYAIAQSNMGNYGLHLALHSNASPDNLSGVLQGSDVYYYQTSVKGRRAAEIIANNLRDIYPYPEKVDVRATTKLAELKQTKAPAVLVEIAYHDNAEDARWIRNNIQAIARNLSISVCEYFESPFVDIYNR